MDKEIQLSGTVGNTIRVPKRVATIKICGGAMTFYVDDTMQWKRPTDEQIKNLKELLAIEVIPEDL
jgi:actin-related protein